MEPLLGSVQLFAGQFAPRGWALCQGQALLIAQNNALYTVLGTEYGGDGRTTFNLPNLSPLKAESGTLNYIIATQGVFPVRS